jgi:hypothetical protein
MKNILAIGIVIVLSSLFFLDCFMFPENELPKKAKIETTKSNGFAMVELFTSEGCSSCPPADELMAKLQFEAKDKNMYFLAYHVDYWDRLGWKDQFSSNDFTKRQQQYQDWLNLFVMYTPQFIINGTTEFAGYNEAALNSKVSSALEIKTDTGLGITAKSAKDSVEIHFKTNLLHKNTNLFLAIVQKQGTSKIERGENKGNTLHHVQIARQLSSIPLIEKEGNLIIPKPEKFNSKDFELIGFIQNTDTGKITITTKATLE